MEYKATSFEERIEIIELLENSGYNIGPNTKRDLYDLADYNHFPVIYLAEFNNFFSLRTNHRNYNNNNTKEEFLRFHNVKYMEPYKLTPFRFR